MTLKNLPENQCVFVRGFFVTPSKWFLPKRLKAAAGPSPDPRGYGCDLDREAISIPATTQVNGSVRISQSLSYLILQSSVILFTSYRTISPR